MALITTLEIEPVEELIELREAKTHMSLEEGETIEDEFIDTLIKVAREYVEKASGYALLDQTWSYYLNEWPKGDEIILPYPPLIWTEANSYIKYTDSAGTVTTLTITTDYVIDTDRRPGRIVLAYGKTWPSPDFHPRNPIHIYYDCGWTDPENVPATYKHIMKLLISDMYENREPTIIGVSATTLKTIDRLIAISPTDHTFTHGRYE